MRWATGRWEERRFRDSVLNIRRKRSGNHQTRQASSGIMGWPLWQPKALPNSSKLRTVPLARNMPGE